jgi:hypothetical protein
MRPGILTLFTLGIATAAGFAPLSARLHRSSVLQDHEGKNETTVEVSKLPAPVQATAKKVFGKLDGLKASQEKEGGSVLFEVEGKGADGMDVSFTCPDNGQIYELEHGIAPSSLPGDAGSKLKQMFPGATVLSACSVEMHYFEVKLQKDGKTSQAMVGVSGRVYQQEGDEEGDEEGEEGEEGGR